MSEWIDFFEKILQENTPDEIILLIKQKLEELKRRKHELPSEDWSSRNPNGEC